MSRRQPATRPALHRLLAVACAAALAVTAAGCAEDAPAGAGETAPAATTTVLQQQAPARSGPLSPGEQIAATTDSPKAFARALKAKRPVVVTFVLRGIADDDYVDTAVKAVRRTGLSRGVEYITYDVSSQKGFGNLPAILNVTGTPSVTVIGRDGRLVNAWTGLVDEKMLRQAVSDAKDATPN